MEMSLLKNRHSLIGFCALEPPMGNPDAAAAEKTAAGADFNTVVKPFFEIIASTAAGQIRARPTIRSL